MIQEIHRELHTRVPGGFQAERLTEMLEERHGGERMGEILQSLQTERRHSPYCREVQTDFQNLRGSGLVDGLSMIRPSLHCLKLVKLGEFRKLVN